MLNAMYAAGCVPAWQRSSHTPARQVVAPTGGIVRGWFPSIKAQRMVAFESLLERDALYLFEFSPAVANIQEQPFKLQYACGDVVRRYTPDFALDLHDGRTVIVEIKPENKLLQADVAESLRCIEAAFMRQGQVFRVLSDLTIRTQPRLANLQQLYPKRRCPLPETIVFAIQHLAVSPSRPHTLGELANALGNHLLALQAVAHGAIGIDYSVALGPRSQVFWSGEEVCHGLDYL